MADEDSKSRDKQAPADADTRATTRRARGGTDAAASDETPVQPPETAPRMLNRGEREMLRSRLQRKFH